jgi:mannose-6-phosphate isomerase-like protein (cupin superfamily)
VGDPSGRDELLYVVEGAVEVTVLADGAPQLVRVDVGTLFVAPRGLWHRQRTLPHAVPLFATAADTTARPWADDPRV